MQEEELPEHEELGKKNKKSDNGNINNTVALGIMPLQISLYVFNMHCGSNYHCTLDPATLHLPQLLTVTMKFILGTD